uniref:VHS domain-containing protein n=1 Tax=Timema poppense TaxID=170557 RepID=A0A7R9GU09_TIMPO|nr:unnamed protein product [Timema poppensis]
MGPELVSFLLEQATDASLASENWALNMEICDIINGTEDGPKDAIKAIRKRLTQNAGKNYTVVMYTLTVLETCVKNCGKRFHILACNKEFVQELVKLIGPKNDPPTAVQEKVLSLIQCWADAFRHQAELTGVVQVYSDLKQKGIEFPMTDLDTMAPIHTPQRSIPDSDHGIVQTAIPVAPMPVAMTMPMPVSPMMMPPVSPAIQQPQLVVGGPTTLTADQLGKLQGELDVVQGNMVVLSEMLSELTPGKEHSSDLELLQTKIIVSLVRAVTHMENLENRNFMVLVSRCKAGWWNLLASWPMIEITAELLRVNDELNNLFLRYNRFENNRDASRPLTTNERVAVAAAAAAAGVEVGADSLIDLSDEAVEATPTTGLSNLNTKLAGMSLSGGTATSQLSMISSVPAQQGSQKDLNEKEDSEFDMFAQSRNVSYESSKTGGSTYKDNLEPDQVNGALGAVAQNRSQPVTHSESDFDEMAAWLEEKPTSAASGGPEESLTSSEFERFLAERAAAAEALPTVTQLGNLPTPPTTRPHHHRTLNKEAEAESSLFAL